MKSAPRLGLDPECEILWRQLDALFSLLAAGTSGAERSALETACFWACSASYGSAAAFLLTFV
jgi:hypothetical protein